MMRRLVVALGSSVGPAVLIFACTDLGGLNAGGGPPDTTDASAAEAGGDASAQDSARDDAEAPVDAGVEGGPDSGCDGPCPRIVFVTSSPFTGDLGGLAGADLKCGAAAKASATLQGRTFLAWVSTASVNAASRFPDAARPFVREDGTPLAADRSQLTSGSLKASVTTNELGVAVPPLTEVWTGTKENGQAAPSHCLSWTHFDAAEKGAYGVATSASVIWTYSSEDTCASSRRLYCVEN
jgi:Protein of unknown function (DUF1554)